MPDKPKRRKNNRNKRKNKSNRSDLNKNSNSEVNESELTESCSVQSELPDDCGDTESQEVDSLLQNKTDDAVSASDNIIDEVSSQSQEVESLLQNKTDNAVLASDNIIDEVSSSVSQQTSDNPEDLNQDLNNNSECTTSSDFIPNSTTEDIQISENYIVESPEQSQRKCKRKDKLKIQIKSKSLDNDDDPKIEEITDENANHCLDETTMEIIDSNVLVSDVESDIEWEKIDEDPNVETEGLATGTLSITTIPLNIAQCKQAQALSSDEETSLRNYLQTLNLSTNPSINAIEIKTEIEQIINREIRHRLSKKGLADDFIAPRLGPPRILDVIDEESSESSVTSRRQSYLSDKKSDNDDLEDDVFEAPKTKPPIPVKPNIARKQKTLGRLVPQECVLVGAKLKEANVAEARGNWSVQTVEQMKGAEVVYLTDSSSSTSSVHEIGEDTDDGEDTDVSIRMITPTIEVTDADNLLKNTFVTDSKNENIKAVNNENETLRENVATITENEFDKPNYEVSDGNTAVDISSHEIVVYSTDNINTNLYVKDVEEIKPSEDEYINIKSDESTDNIVDVTNTAGSHNDEIKVLKSELNDAISNLIKEVCSDSENNENSKDNFIRQDSSSSIGSSQCTAKYNPTYSSLNDVSNIVHDETSEVPSSNKSVEHYVTSHVKDVFECVTGSTTQSNDSNSHKTKQPRTLRDICVQRIAVLPYGEKILEELATVSERLQNINNHKIAIDNTIVTSQKEQSPKDMPYYPLPDVSVIEKVSLPIKYKEPHPPPRNSSLKKSQDDHHWTAVPTKTEPVYVCLSPSQKMLMEKTNTIMTKEDASQLVDMHKKYVDRRGYNEPANKNKHKDFENSDEPPIVPFKSQTGSRLLALIRDPSVTNNIKSATNNHYYSSDRIQNYHTENSNSSFMHRTEHKQRFDDLTNHFKPIPPPRPKKYSSSFYESDESSDFTDNSLRSFKSEKKFFHYSTGNLSKDIENDISSIQNMHRYYKSVRDSNVDFNKPRRPSLPKDICDQQMEYIRQKEKEVEAEIKRLEAEKDNVSFPQKRGPRAPLIIDKDCFTERVTENNNCYESKRKEMTVQSEKCSGTKLSSVFSKSQEELLRDKMYSEYVNQMAQRQERKEHKVIKITNPSSTANTKTVSKSMSALDILDSKVNNQVEKEFISRARERWNKLGITDPETEDERDKNDGLYRESKVIEHKIKVIEGGEEKDVQKLPSHLQEFVNFTAKRREQGQSSSGESGEPASPHVVIWCAVLVVVMTFVRYFLRMLRNM